MRAFITPNGNAQTSALAETDKVNLRGSNASVDFSCIEEGAMGEEAKECDLLEEVSGCFVDAVRRAMRVAAEDDDGELCALSQTDLAERAEVARSTLAKYFGARSEDPARQSQLRHHLPPRGRSGRAACCTADAVAGLGEPGKRDADVFAGKRRPGVHEDGRRTSKTRNDHLHQRGRSRTSHWAHSQNCGKRQRPKGVAGSQGFQACNQGLYSDHRGCDSISNGWCRDLPPPRPADHLQHSRNNDRKRKPMSQDFIQNPTDLSLLLAQADAADLDILVDYITDSGKGRIALDGEVCARLAKCKDRGTYTELDRNLISHEIRTFGGNTIANIYRDARASIPVGSLLDKVLPDSEAAVAYDEVVKDVAAHLKVPFSKDADVLVVEDGILRKILRDSFEKMSPEQRSEILKELNVADLSMLAPASGATLIAAGRIGGFASYKLALFVANAVSKALLGRGLPLAANAMLSRTVGVLLGPIGWVVTGLWTLADMASPAYRVTVPCVIQIAYMRQKAIVKAQSKECAACGAPNLRAAKFCAECGKAFEGV